MPSKDLSPLGDQGLRKDVPTWQVKWDKLDNVIFRNGRLQPRPGLIHPWGLAYEILPSVERGIPLAIMDVLNPSDTVARTGGGSYTYIGDTLRPDAIAHTVAGWLKPPGDGDPAIVGNVNEAVPDGSPMRSRTNGSIARFNFDDVDGGLDFGLINALVLRGTARTAWTGQVATLEFFIKSGTKSVGTVEIIAAFDGESDTWQNFAVVIPFNFISGDRAWTESTVNSTNIDVKFLKSSALVHEFLAPSGDGADTEWVDATNGGTAGFADFNELPTEYNFTRLIGDESGTNGARGGDGLKQSWTYGTFTAEFSPINSITLSYLFSKGVSVEPSLRFYYVDSVGTEFTLGTTQLTGTSGDPPSRWERVNLTVAENPATESAWTETTIRNGEFGVETLVTAATLEAQQIHIQGQVAGADAEIQVDTLALDVYGADTSGASVVPGPDLLWSTTKTHFRYEPGERLVDVDVTDVTNSVGMGSPGHVPLDFATLYGQVYLVDGTVATRRYPNSSDVWEALTTNNSDGSTILTGRTVASFAGRILYGWVSDNGSVTPERVVYSKQFDGGTHVDTNGSAGDFDLLDTRGGVLMLKALSEDICAAYKEVGVYALRITGNSVAPIIRDVIDFETRLLAPLTVKPLSDASGSPVHLFLGENPSVGINVFAFNGSQVKAVGTPINAEIIRDANANMLKSAFAEVDPEGNLYWLFFAEGDNLYPNSGYVFDLLTGVWTRFTLPDFVSCAGRWTLADETAGTSKYPSISGKSTLVVGGMDGLVRRLSYDFASDASFPYSTTNYFSEVTFGNFDETIGRRREFFSPIIETGDYRMSDDFTLQANVTRIHLGYYDMGVTPVAVSVSTDGGVTFNTEQTYFIGGRADRSYRYSVLDLDVIQARRARFRLDFSVDGNDAGDDDPRFELGEMWIEYEPAGADI